MRPFSVFSFQHSVQGSYKLLVQTSQSPTIYTSSPLDLGAPSKFKEWRDGQDRLFWDIVDCTKRFSIHNAPVGMGKSLAAVMAAIVTGKRVAYLTESKGLQDQISADFAECGLFDMRGLQNYTCQALAEGGFLEKMWTKQWDRPTCDIGPCISGLRCDLKNAGCDYFDSHRSANGAKLVLTNYAYWIAIHKYGQGLGKFDMVILDEAHSAEGALSSALSVEFVPKDFRELGTEPIKITAALQDWRMWARVQLMKCQGKLEFFTAGARIGQTVDERGVLTLVNDTDLPDASELRFWKRLEGKCQMVSESNDDWIVEQDEASKNIRLAPAFIGKYVESALLRDIPRVVMMSGTVRPKTADLMDIAESEREFIEYPSTFPVERRPIYWLPTVRLNSKSPPEDLRTWVVRIDQILARRPHLKGIIHTRSYQRQQYLLAHSRFKNIMYANTQGNMQKVVKDFRAADPPAVLVSPSVGTGFDFPYSACRFQIIGKMPFYDKRGAVMKAQIKLDPDYPNYLTSQDLIQLYGRPNRAPDDFSETWIVDDHFEWFVQQYSGYKFDEHTGKLLMNAGIRAGKPNRWFFPDYFLEAVQRVDGVMDPPSLESINC